MAELIVVDDEPALAGMLEDFLSGAGHSIRLAHDGVALRRHLEHAPAELVLLDIGLPGENGLDLLRYLRATHELGIIMLTGSVEVEDRVGGLDSGADDYLPKPFSLPELKARIDAVLRRRRTMGLEMLAFGPLRLDLRGWKLLGENGDPLQLFDTEIDLIAAFATHPEKVLSRDDLLRLAPGHGEDPLDRSVDTRITRLRGKLERLGVDPDLIRTARGSGYIYSVAR
jgi:DNA-binding response OmpR family regulator